MHRQLIYSRGAQAAIEFAETQPDGATWTTYDLVRAVIDAVWAPIKESKG